MESLESMMTTGQEISEEFETITENFICGTKKLTYSYEPSLDEIDYLGEYLMQSIDLTRLNLEKIILIEQTGSRLGKLLSNSQIDKIYIEIKSDGELALLREMQKIKEYYFIGGRIGFNTVLYSLARSLNKFLTEIEFLDSTITDDGLRIILSGLKVKMTEAEAFNYTVKWDESTDLNALGLDELFECVEDQKLTVFNSSIESGNKIKINNIFKENSFLHIKVDYNQSETDDIKRFLNQNKNKKNLVVKVKEWDEECFLLMTMIDIMKDFPMKLIIDWRVLDVSEEIANKIMDSLIKTNLEDLRIDIEYLTSDIYQMICDKLKNMKIQNLSIRNIELFNFNSKTVVKPLEIPGLNSLSIQDCILDYKLSKEIFLKLEQSKLKTFALVAFYFGTKLAGVLSNSLIGSNITELRITFSGLQCKEVKIIAEALKDTNITSISFTGNKIKDAGVIAIANVVEQTKLNSLNLNGNEFHVCGAIELLKSVQKMKIVSCGMYYCKNISGSLDAIANILKDNKILLYCMEKGKNTKIGEYLERNYNSFKKAKLIIDKYQKGSILYDYKHKEHFEAYESFIDTDILWNDVDDDKERMKLNLGNKIADNYLKICGVINKKLEVHCDYSKRQVNFSHLSLEILNNIFSYLNISDVVD